MFLVSDEALPPHRPPRSPPQQDLPLSPGLNDIYEQYFFFGQLEARMASTATIASSPAVEDLDQNQALPSMADWTLTKPPTPIFTDKFIENNLNNIEQHSSLLDLLQAPPAHCPPQMDNGQHVISAVAAHSPAQPKSPLLADTPTKQPQKVLNRYIGVLGDSASSPSQQAPPPTFTSLPRNRYECNLCQEVVNGVHEKFIHRNQHLGRSYQCQYCGTVFPTSIDVVRHAHIMHKHSHKCPKCDFVGTDKDSFFAHMDRVHAPTAASPPKRKLEVSLSPPSSSEGGARSPKISKKHVAIEVENCHVTCSLCPKETAPTLPSQAAYVAHINDEHALQGSQYPFMCPFSDCFREFEEQDILTKHLSSHTAVRRFKCSLCDKAFKTVSQSKKHEDEVHTNSDLRPFACSWPDCDKRFKASKHLQVHYMIHTDEKPIHCEYCDYRCRQRNSINYHYKTKHPGCTPPKIVPLGTGQSSPPSTSPVDSPGSSY